MKQVILIDRTLKSLYSLCPARVSVALAYGIRSYPELVVIDSKGTIVACPRNLEELASVLEKLK